MRARQPTKAFEESPELDFEFYLANKWGCTVGELRLRISQEEFRKQMTWHGRRNQRNTMREV